MVVSTRVTSAAPSIDPWPYHQLDWISTPAHVLAKGERRLEAETYLAEGYGIRMSIEARSGCVKLGTLAKVWQPSRLKGVQVNPDHGSPFLAASQVYDTRPIPRKWLALARTRDAARRFVERGMILVTCSGAVGRATLAYQPHLNTLITHDLLRVEALNESDLGWIYAYVRAPKVRAMMRSVKYGHIIKHLEASHLRNLPIPIIPPTSEFNETANRILDLRDQAYAAMMKAEALLASHMGTIENPQDGESGFEAKASEVLFSGRRRMDAAYSSPLIIALKRHLDRRDMRSSIIDDHFDVWLPSRFKRIRASNGVALLGSADLFKVNPDVEKRIGDGDFGDPYRGRVKPRWLLLARSGQVYGLNGSATLATEAATNKVVSDDIIRVAPKPNAEMRTGYLVTFLSHPTLGRPLVKALAYGSSIPHIDPGDFAALSVPRLSKHDEDAIADLAEESAHLRGAADILEDEIGSEAEAILDQFISGVPTPETRRAKFKRLSQEWLRDRPRGADVTDMVKHPAHREIVDMGSRVVPWILAELKRSPDHWFWALHSITGADPVLPSHRGQLESMANDWLAWGREQGYRR